jgi:(2Fe-2S) ferredoxin
VFRSALEAKQARAETELVWQSCFGRCTQGPNVLVREILTAAPPTIGSGFATAPGPRGSTALYNRVDSERAERIVVQHIGDGTIIREFIERPGIHPLQPLGSTTAKDSDP